MVYNDDINSIKIETGNLLPEDFPDTELTKNLENAFSTVQLTAKRKLDNPFVSTDTEFGHCRELEKKIAAMNSLKPYTADPNIREKVIDLQTEIDHDLIFLQENTQQVAEVTDVSIFVDNTDYLSTGAILSEDPANLRNAPIPYRSGLTNSV